MAESTQWQLGIALGVLLHGNRTLYAANRIADLAMLREVSIP